MFEIMNKVIKYMNTMYSDEIQFTTSLHGYEDLFGVHKTYKTCAYVFNEEIFEIFKSKISTAITSTIDFSINSEFAIEVTPNRIILNYPDLNDEDETVFELHYI